MVPRLSKVLSQAAHSFRERDLAISCAQCDEERNIAGCITKADAEVRSYRCRECGDLLVLIGYPSDREIAGKTCRAGTWWSIRPMNDLFVQLKTSRLTLPAAPRAPIFGRPLL